MSTWSAKKFAEGKQNSWPFECDDILAFRGTGREIFFPREHSPDLGKRWGGKSTKLSSVLETRYLIPLNFNGTKGVSDSFKAWKEWYKSKLGTEEGLNEDQAERVWEEFLNSGKANRAPEAEEMLDTREPGVFFAPRQVVEARGYYTPEKPGRILLRLQIPTDSVVVNNRRDNQDNRRCKNTRMMERAFNSKEEFREICEYATRHGNKEYLQYITADADISWITGVLDKECSDNFVSLGDYVRWLKKRCIWEMDKFSFEVRAHDGIKEEVRFLTDLGHELRKLDYYLQIIRENAGNVRDEVKDWESEMGGKWRRYTSYRGRYIRDMERLLNDIDRVITGRDVKGPGYTAVKKNVFHLVGTETEIYQEKNSSIWNRGYKADHESFAEMNKVRSVKELFHVIDKQVEITQTLIKEIEGLKEEEKQHRNVDIDNEDSFRKEEEFEHRVNSRIVDDLEKLITLAPLEKKVRAGIERIEKEKGDDRNYAEVKTDPLGFIHS